MRKSSFITNDKMINRWNAKGNVTHRLGHSKMSDWSDEEYQRIRPRLVQAPKFFDDEATIQEFDLSDLPESVNWVEKGAVIPVDDVFLCAANWALTAAAAITGSHFAQTGEFFAVSGQ